MVLSALDSTALALESGLHKSQIIISCKVSRPLHLIAVYRELAKRTEPGASSRSSLPSSAGFVVGAMLGPVADGSPGDMKVAIAGARDADDLSEKEASKRPPSPIAYSRMVQVAAGTPPLSPRGD